MAKCTVSEQCGCRIITGQLPISAMDLLSRGFSKKAVLDHDLARMLGASFVVGEPEALARLREDPHVLASARARFNGEDYSNLSPAAREWLATGDRGASSDAMFARFTGIGTRTTACPVDPSDFRRCRLLIERVPEFASLLPAMRDVSGEWAVLVDRWEELCALMDSETPEWRAGRGDAHKTYAALKAIRQS
ncbi:hypothetical protein [Ralstonia sp. ASV6]|uniref:hypothetical protein n=1 Tax=Ralstonia sp. ASV6 TaxID=2795124 RepID=UPI0018ED546C|nr:hypothetical protein [Ralstonia sp. ASV6]